MSAWGLFEGTPWEEESVDQHHKESKPVDFIPMETQRHYFDKLANELKSLDDLLARCEEPECDSDSIRQELELLLDDNIGFFLFHLGYKVEALEEIVQAEPAVEPAVNFVKNALERLVGELQPHMKE